jgi:hypothetical protein
MFEGWPLLPARYPLLIFQSAQPSAMLPAQGWSAVPALVKRQRASYIAAVQYERERRNNHV